MDHEREPTTTSARVAPTGRLDTWNAWELRHELAALIDDGVRAVVIDLAGLQEVDLAGVGVLAGARATIERRGGVLVVVHPTPAARAALRMAGLSSLLDLPASTPLPAPAPVRRPGPTCTSDEPVGGSRVLRRRRGPVAPV